MIAYDLRCAAGHCFEAWFRSAETFDEQVAAGVVTCPRCGDAQVTKAPMAPFVARSTRPPRSEPAALPKSATVQDAARALIEHVRRHVEATCIDVGRSFPEEARRIHYREAEPRGIYGEASETEARQLLEEGIEVQRLPWFQRRND